MQHNKWSTTAGRRARLNLYDKTPNGPLAALKNREKCELHIKEEEIGFCIIEFQLSLKVLFSKKRGSIVKITTKFVSFFLTLLWRFTSICILLKYKCYK